MTYKLTYGNLTAIHETHGNVANEFETRTKKFIYFTTEADARLHNDTNLNGRFTVTEVPKRKGDLIEHLKGAAYVASKRLENGVVIYVIAVSGGYHLRGWVVADGVDELMDKLRSEQEAIDNLSFWATQPDQAMELLQETRRYIDKCISEEPSYL